MKKRKFSRVSLAAKKISRISLAAECCEEYALELQEFIKKIEAAYTNQSASFISHALTNVEKENLMSQKSERLQSQLSDMEKKWKLDMSLKEEEIEKIRDECRKQIHQVHLQMLNLKYSLLPEPLIKNMTENSLKRIELDMMLLMSGANIVDLERHIQKYEDVTVSIISIAGFNTIALRYANAPHLLLELLNQYYDAIDRLTREFKDIYLVDRICDKCIIVCGAPNRNKSNCETSAKFALRVREWAHNWDASYLLQGPESALHLKIGMHSGPILGGVIGQIPKFLAIGETTNIAFTLEQACQRMCLRFPSSELILYRR